MNILEKFQEHVVAAGLKGEEIVKCCALYLHGINDQHNENWFKLTDNDIDAIMKYASKLADEKKPISMDEVVAFGEVVEDSSSYGYENYYSDAPGGEMIGVKIMKYEGIFYCLKEKVIDYPVVERQFVDFYELKK